MGSAGSQAGVHRLSMTHLWEAAQFDDACTVPTPCLLLSEIMQLILRESDPTKLISFFVNFIPSEIQSQPEIFFC